jgi:hypothetical protein
MKNKTKGIFFIIILTLFVMMTVPSILISNKVFSTGIFNKDNNINIKGGKQIDNLFSNFFDNSHNNNLHSDKSSEKYTLHYYISGTHNHCIKGTLDCAFNGGR